MFHVIHLPNIQFSEMSSLIFSIKRKWQEKDQVYPVPLNHNTLFVGDDEVLCWTYADATPTSNFQPIRLFDLELIIQIHIHNGKQCRSRSVGFFRSQLIWICICLQRQDLSGFSRTSVKLVWKDSKYLPFLLREKTFWLPVCFTAHQAPNTKRDEYAPHGGSKKQYWQFCLPWKCSHNFP